MEKISNNVGERDNAWSLGAPERFPVTIALVRGYETSRKRGVRSGALSTMDVAENLSPTGVGGKNSASLRGKLGSTSWGWENVCCKGGDFSATAAKREAETQP